MEPRLIGNSPAPARACVYNNFVNEEQIWESQGKGQEKRIWAVELLTLGFE